VREKYVYAHKRERESGRYEVVRSLTYNELSTVVWEELISEINPATPIKAFLSMNIFVHF
jgi:hypothetical protein